MTSSLQKQVANHAARRHGTCCFHVGFERRLAWQMKWKMNWKIAFINLPQAV
jgi:hypothetical protein